MRQTPTNLDLSPTDLANHLVCRHKTAQDLALAKGLRKHPAYSDPAAEALAQRGLEHEKAYVATLPGVVVDLTDQPDRVARWGAFIAPRRADRAGPW